jgi:hypothetical protein
MQNWEDEGAWNQLNQTWEIFENIHMEKLEAIDKKMVDL